MMGIMEREVTCLDRSREDVTVEGDRDKQIANLLVGYLPFCFPSDTFQYQ